MRTLTRRRSEVETAPEPEAAPPPGFQPLADWVKARIIGCLGEAMLFRPWTREGEGFTISFSPSGRAASEDVEPDRVIHATVADGWEVRSWTRRIRPPQATGGHRPEGDVLSLSRAVPPETVESLDEWYSDAEGRCWRVGTPWPELEPPEDEWPRLAPRVITEIRRYHGHMGPRPVDSVGRPIGGNYEVAFDPTTGAFRGTLMDPEVAQRRDFFVLVPASQYVEDLDFSSLRMSPVSGKVRPSPVPLLPEVA
jgi:hypothetical protein